MKRWYLIHTKPRQEQLAEENLRRQGFETYLPMAEIRRKRRGRSVRVIDPMFPRYLFIHLSDETDDWRPIRSTLGVAALVKFGQEPARLPDQLIDNLRKRETESGYHKLEAKAVTKGTTVRIAEGPFEGFEGIYQCDSGKERVVLLLQIAQQAVKIDMLASHIEPV
ncbi:MAG: transcription/translation regulatory transformer protein RfaH [Gammaproteobacteria bacterium]|nr:transcription/translation regulatory transformer protein RfaH [Gammaproteobacteria bacterium]NIQ74959.1 transcription/translation regulatory transformer protein RfaH [Gammaproteobacteria bacterium]NIR95556.1 transcription/translation regulatory transformer protein RfaH [Gammaproteobacteria bacterium]NIV26205.1 transcription/translation regulatory transformer protein RfaH [Gammaproteobacteria bacterium]NIW09332.1 transcription/translation regulatory transformer protein RfaH [Gammaproteobacter